MTDKAQSTAEEILASIGTALDQYEVFHNQILIGVYIRPGKTKSGILLPDSVTDEDRWQGKVGLVLKVGPAAFVNDARNEFHGQSVKPGDWVIYRVNDGTSLDINKTRCRQMEDIHIRGRVANPEIIW